MTAEVNSLSSATSNNLSKDGQDQRIFENPEHSDNLETGEVGKVLTIYEDDRRFYQEQKEITAKAFLETLSENYPIFLAAIKGFCDSYNADNKKWEQAVPHDVQNAVMLGFN